MTCRCAASLGGARAGVDFSPPAIDAARALAERLGASDAEFVVADIYDAASALGGRRFGIVYTGKGALTWLPDLTRWADVCRRVVAPGGVLYLSEFHPAGNVFDWGDDLSLTYSYFTDEPTVNETRGTCADLDAQTHENVGSNGTISSARSSPPSPPLASASTSSTSTPSCSIPAGRSSGDETTAPPGSQPTGRRLPLFYSVRACCDEDSQQRAGANRAHVLRWRTLLGDVPTLARAAPTG